MTPSMLTNVVVVTDFAFVNGGAGKVAIDGAVELARMGYRVTLFCAIGPIAEDLVNVRNLRVVCLEQHDVISDQNRLRAALRGIWNTTAARRLRSVLGELDSRDTIVHIHCWTKGLSANVFRVAADCGFEVVHTVHEYFTVCPTGTFYNHRRRAVCPLTPMSVSCVRENCDSRGYAQKVWRLARHVALRGPGRLEKSVARFVTVSDFSQRIVAKYLTRDAAFTHVDNPIGVDRAPKVAAENNDKFLFVGRFSHEKGATLFAEAAKRADVRTVFVGSGPLDKEIRRTNPEAEMTGWLEPAAVIGALHSARVLVLPSVWYETFGLIVLEAAAVGVPAVVPRGSAAEELVIDGVTGITFESGNVTALSNALGRLADASFVEQLSRNAYERYWEKPQPLRRHAEQLSALYASILSSLPAGRAVGPGGMPSLATSR